MGLVVEMVVVATVRLLRALLRRCPALHQQRPLALPQYLRPAPWRHLLLQRHQSKAAQTWLRCQLQVCPLQRLLQLQPR